ncbi:alpha/beta-hydrolase [Irpex rosettiformis]|uniref:Alpha/beta-hydrolase n=1 Tax=Irpex rosettiformis TaxID=378272 RepID=A0ACB8TTE9_9APHY|nr:alpha/beta-hydrolase [Irpex rosettiformis]
MSPQTAPYGTWPSPVSASAIALIRASVDEVIVDPVTSSVYHIEGRPSEGGRNVLVNTEAGIDVVGQGWNVRTGVQEYGGAAAIVYDGKAIFSNIVDGRAYIVAPGGEPKPITPESKVWRYACFCVYPTNPRFVVAVLEDHTHPAPSDVTTRLSVIDTETQTVYTLASGADFYAKPSFSPDGAYLAWQQWSHPDMPWDGAQVAVTKVSFSGNDLKIGEVSIVAGKHQEVSAGYPMWASSSLLLFTCDASGYANPWSYNLETQKAGPVLQTPVAEDFDSTMWILGWSFGAPLDKEGKTALYTAFRNGRSVLYVVTTTSNTLEEIECPFVTVQYIRPVAGDAVVFLGAKTDESDSIILCTLKDYSKPHFTVLGKKDASEPSFGKSLFSQPQPLTLTVPGTKEPFYVAYYPPTNPGYVGPPGEKPPCVVSVHGGPTSYAPQSLQLTVQFFTTRGFAWVDVNYSGSSGYGREYTSRLSGKWGVADTRDCALTATLLSSPPYNLVDAKRTAIRGRSSGGYDVLETLCLYPDAFAAGASLFGISDLKKLDEFTHKFESRYCEKLIGGTYESVPELYRERSPIYNAHNIKAPLLILQGSEDAVVPPEQAEGMVKTIKEKGGQVEYVVFEGEGHGWRKAETIQKALETELAFYEKAFGLCK